MVQICSSCNEKHAHMAEGSTAATTFDGRYTPSDNKSQTNSESSNVRFKVKTIFFILSFFYDVMSRSLSNVNSQYDKKVLGDNLFSIFAFSINFTRH